MKKFLIVSIALLFGLSAYAKLPLYTNNNNNGLPRGTFKKNWRGRIVQYDKNGKKAGTYKLSGERYIKIK